MILLTSDNQLDYTHSALCGISDKQGFQIVYRFPGVGVSQRAKEHGRGLR